MEAKLFNKDDQALMEDLKAADLIYKKNNGLTHKQIYDRLNLHKVSKQWDILIITTSERSLFM